MAVFDFVQQSPVSGVGFLYKSATSAYYYTGTVVVPIRSSATFIATTGSGTVSLNVSEVLSGTLTIGMTLTGLDSTRIIDDFDTFDGTSGTITLNDSTTWTDPTTVTGTYAVDNDYPVTTVRGIQYLDGTYYVMTPNGSIYGSDINAPTIWSAINVIQSQIEPDKGVYLGRQLNLLVAFSEYSTEFFYDAGNPTGSPLLPYSSSALELGCATADSVAQTENTMYFMGVAKQKGRGLYRLVGTNPEYLSNAFIDRIFNADDLSDVSAFCVRIGGHSFYVLYLGDTNVTLVYDDTSKQWAYWTVSIPTEPLEIDDASWTDGIVTFIQEDHGYQDGDIVTTVDCDPPEYDGAFTITVVDADTWTAVMAVDPDDFVSGGTSTSYTQEPFAVASYTSGNNLDIIQDSTTGFIYLLDNGTYEDNGNPLDVLIQTFKFDAGDNKKKFISQLEVIGDKVESTALVRYTNDDYQTWSNYRPVNLEQDRSLLNRQGQTRRRAYNVRHHENVPLRLESLELEVIKGTN